MNREEKTQLLGELNELFNSSEIIVVSHYKGLTVKEVSELRDKIRKAGAGFRVTKNRITRLALKGTKFEGLTDLFTGPTAIAFANDPVSACKACVQFAKDNEKLIVVGGATVSYTHLTLPWEPVFFRLPKSINWQRFRLWTNSEPRLSVCCRLRVPSWHALPELTARKKPLSIIVYASSACGFFIYVPVCSGEVKSTLHNLV